MSVRYVAETIRKQVGIMGLAVVGASHLAFSENGSGGGSLTFKARLHYRDQTKVRVMRVFIELNEKDLYDVRVVTPEQKSVVFAHDVYADELTAVMYRLDAEGVPKEE